MRAGKRDMALRVPVLGQDDMIELRCERVDTGNDLVAALNLERAAGQEVKLHIDNKENVGGSEIKHRLHILEGSHRFEVAHTVFVTTCTQASESPAILRP